MELIVDMMRPMIEESNRKQIEELKEFHKKQMENINGKLSELKHELKQDNVQLREEIKEE